MQKLTRLKAEMEMLTKSPPPGIRCWQNDVNSTKIFVEMTGPSDSPFEKGVFHLDVELSERYPFDPPSIQFVTPVYHPNIDPNGRICLTALKPKPLGTWSVIMNIPTVLSAIRVMLAEPNTGDALMTGIAKEYMEDYGTYVRKAKEATEKAMLAGNRASTIDDEGEDGSRTRKKLKFDN